MIPLHDAAALHLVAEQMRAASHVAGIAIAAQLSYWADEIDAKALEVAGSKPPAPPHLSLVRD